MNKFRYFPDLVNSVGALLAGGAVASFLHNKWYYGGWMAMFGDPPAVNPAYDRFVHLFEMAPYVAAGLAAGLIAGFGCPELSRVSIRFASLVTLLLVLFAGNQRLAIFDFGPVALGSFLVSTGLSWAYFHCWFPDRPDKPTGPM